MTFFAIFLEFSITGQVRNDRNDNFYFHSFSAFPNRFWLQKKPFFCNFFGVLYYGLGRNWSEGKFLFSPFLGLYQLVLAWKEAIMVFFNFLNFLAIFLEFSITDRVGNDRNDNFYFHSFSAIPNLFSLEKKPQWWFLTFSIFFAIFYYGSGRN